VKIMSLHQVKPGMVLAQNLFRHDSLLALPKGTVLFDYEINVVKSMGIEYALVYEQIKDQVVRYDVNYMLDIIESGFTQNSLLEKKYAKALYDLIENRIIKNKKVQEYLNQLRIIDSYSFSHCVNVAVIVALILNDKRPLTKEFAEVVYMVLLHDIGRIHVKHVFNKQGILTNKEYEELIKHPEYSFQMLKKAGFDEHEIRFVIEHHEKYDGSGYPWKVKKEEICDLAQLVQLADMYNGLSSFRPHRIEFEPFEVIEMIQKEKGRSFNPRLVDLFMERFIPYRVGCIVELNNGWTAVVKELHAVKKTLPVIEIISDKISMKAISINLSYQKDLRIKKIIQS
jgi:HD-GYP domain-containing protein (c-di-GMP phosphodiesterase class II)